MQITVNIADPEPVYEQIVRQVQAGIETGEIAPGQPLPPVRQLATDLQLNRNTVARAYKMLEDQGVIRTAGRKGTFVRPDAAEEVSRLRAGNARRMMRQMVSALMSQGLSREEISEIFHDALAPENTKG